LLSSESLAFASCTLTVDTFAVSPPVFGHDALLPLWPLQALGRRCQTAREAITLACLAATPW